MLGRKGAWMNEMDEEERSLMKHAFDVAGISGAACLGEARTALREVMPGLARLVRTIPDPNVASVGTWRVGEVAAHVTHVIAGDTDAVAERPLPSVTVTTADIAELTAQFLADDRERDPAVLADRIEALAQEFDDVAARCEATTVQWLGSAVLPPSAVACHLLEECLVHGHDIASAIGRPWPIERRHAVLAIEGGALPIIDALPPTAFVNQKRVGSFRARIEVRLRGGGRTHLVFAGGGQTIQPSGEGDVDVHLSADPAALLLLLMGRQAPWRALVAGKVAVWGRRPWKLVRMLEVMSGP
jgi:SCP-2 sterol transfer family protein